MSGTVGQLRKALDKLTQPESAETKAILDKMFEGEERQAKAVKEIAWAGASWGTVAAEPDAFARMVAEADKDQIVVAGLIVVFTDGSWIEQESDDWGGKAPWTLKYPEGGPERGDGPLTVIADADGTEIDEANQYDEPAEAGGG